MPEEQLDFTGVGRVPPHTPLRVFDEPQIGDGFDEMTASLLGEIQTRHTRTEDEEFVLATLMETAAASGLGDYSAEQLQAMKHTFTASGGNLAEVARTHDVEARKVARLASELNWPVYGTEKHLAEKSRRTRLESLADVLERQMFELAESLGAETKLRDEASDRGINSAFAASLSQRSGAFSAVFDRWMRVMGMIEPEVFGEDPSAAGAHLRSNAASPDALGGVDGVNRMMADFAARLSVGIVQGIRKEVTDEHDVIDISG